MELNAFLSILIMIELFLALAAMRFYEGKQLVRIHYDRAITLISLRERKG
jgi:hypothetical protein